MKIKKAILTGGGRATRLRPITSTTNKHLLPLANKPMIFHAIEKVVEVGVEEIYINTNFGGDPALVETVGDGSRWGVKIVFFEQVGGPLGIAHVVKEAERFIGDEPFIFYLSDNIILGSIQGLVDEFERENYDCMLALAEVPDPERFGVPVFDTDNKLINVVEKPSNPPSKYAVTGIYIYAGNIFYDAYDKIRLSERGEYEISDIHARFLSEGRRVGYKIITGWWKDTGKVPDLLLADRLLMDEMNLEDFKICGKIDTSVKTAGKISLGKNSEIKGKSNIIGPVILGDGVIIEDSTVGPYVTVLDGTRIINTKIKNSIILANAHIEVDTYVSNSLIGNKSVITKKSSDSDTTMIVGDQTVLSI